MARSFLKSDENDQSFFFPCSLVGTVFIRGKIAGRIDFSHAGKICFRLKPSINDQHENTSVPERKLLCTLGAKGIGPVLW